MRVLRMTRACAWAVLLAPLVAHASGYAIYEQGAAALGMAGAYVASAHDATAEFYNPAALPRLEGSQLSIGGGRPRPRPRLARGGPVPGFGPGGGGEDGHLPLPPPPPAGPLGPPRA